MAEDAAKLGKALLYSPGFIDGGNWSNYWPRIDVYSTVSRVEPCIEHLRREKKHREETGGLHFVPNWSQRRSFAHLDPYRNAILCY